MIKETFKPQTLRAVLLVILVLTIAGGLGLFYLGIGEVRKFAIEVNHSVTDAEASNKQVQSLQSLKAQLTDSEALITKANQLFATPADYQNQSITDIRNYAVASGLTILKTNFDAVVPGVNPSMTISLKAPVSYAKLIDFLDSLEGNIPKMQVTKISINHIDGGNNDSVVVDEIKLMIATR